MKETQSDRLDREFGELLQELRVLLPGVQVLFAFLLTLPFTVGFEKTTDAERLLFLSSLLATATSAILLMAPSVRHRGRFRERDKEALIKSANRLTLFATVMLALAIAAAATLVSEFLYGWWVGAAIGVGVLVLVAWFWYGWAAARAWNQRG